MRIRFGRSSKLLGLHPADSSSTQTEAPITLLPTAAPNSDLNKTLSRYQLNLQTVFFNIQDNMMLWDNKHCDAYKNFPKSRLTSRCKSIP
ncbi:hypothetical protein Bca101_059726 [Brassica carinata]